MQINFYKADGGKNFLNRYFPISSESNKTASFRNQGLEMFQTEGRENIKYIWWFKELGWGWGKILGSWMGETFVTILKGSNFALEYNIRTRPNV